MAFKKTERNRPDGRRQATMGPAGAGSRHQSGADDEGSRRGRDEQGQSGKDRYDEGYRRGRDKRDHHDRARAGEEERRDKYGGFNWGADFLGWLVSIAITVLLASIVGAIAVAVGSTLSLTQSEAERSAGSIGLGTAIATLIVLMVGYYGGGYVAGRMSRFDGARQGFGVWLVGLIVTIIVVVIGAVAGSQYDIFSRVNLPAMPIPTDTATFGGLIVLAAVVFGTLLAALLGAKIGQRYHTKVDHYTG